MIPTLGAIILIGVGGTIVAAAWTFLLGVAGFPRALLWNRHPKGSIVICSLGQCYWALGFTAILHGATLKFLSNHENFIGWVIWIGIWIVSILPVRFALRDAADRAIKSAHDYAMTLSLPVAVVALPAFIFFPGLLSPWAWLPYVTEK